MSITASTRTTPNTFAIMRDFINDGALTGVSSSVNFFLVPKILRLLQFCEQCPSCPSLRTSPPLRAARHMRKIYNQKYANEFIDPIMHLVLPVVRKVLVVRSDNSDLEALVWGKNGRVSTPFTITDRMSFHQLNKFCLDLHPEINGYVKSLLQVQREYLPVDGDVNGANFTNRFHLCWSVMQLTSVI